MKVIQVGTTEEKNMIDLCFKIIDFDSLWKKNHNSSTVIEIVQKQDNTVGYKMQSRRKRSLFFWLKSKTHKILQGP